MLNKQTKDVLASLIIGDGCIYRNTSYYISISHSIRQKDYCEWKMNIFNNLNLFDNDIKMHTRLNGANNKYIAYYFRKGSIKFKEIFEDVIIDNKKSARELLKMIKSEQGVSIWFMDDGSVEYSKSKLSDGTWHYCRPNIKLCTNSFDYKDQLFIQKWFKDKYGLDCKIKIEKRRNSDGLNRKDTYYLRFGADASEKLYKTILKNYVHCCPSIEYKFRYAIQMFE